MGRINECSIVQEYAVEDILKERDFQDRKWGAQRHIDPYKWNTILGEEHGEVCEATLDLDHAIKNGDGSADSGKHIAAKYSALRKEIVQVAAVAMAMLEDFDTQMRETGTVRFAK